MTASTITLTTDFGLHDPYVGMMKGVILGINPDARIVDLCHDIQPQAVRQGAFLIGASHRVFPKNTIHVVVVDPGVGTSRKALLLTTPDACFLSPDNGILSYVLSQYEGTLHPSDALPPGCKAYVLTNECYWRHPVSSTFHGRDIFAPVAAHLSLGVPPEEFGPPASSVERLPVESPRWVGNVLSGRVAHIDRFGNLATDIPSEVIAGVEEIAVEVAGNHITGLAGVYAEEQGLLAIVGSYGYLEVSVRGGSAADRLGAKIGDPVRVIAESVGG